LNLIGEDNPIDEISRIEARLEELAKGSERCRKIILVSKVAIAGGVASLLFMVLGLFGSNQVAAIGSIAMVFGGIVSLGSNVSTLRQIGGPVLKLRHNLRAARAFTMSFRTPYLWNGTTKKR
jgi:hypothetical protein